MEYYLPQGESLKDSEVVKRLDTRLQYLIEVEQDKTDFIDHNLSKLIKELSDIRLRPAIYCIHCHTDLTLKICKHHNTKTIQKDIDFYNKIKLEKQIPNEVKHE